MAAHAPMAPPRRLGLTLGLTLGRTLARIAGVGAAAGLILALVGAGTAAYADTPVSWQKVAPVSVFQFVVLLLLIPGGIALVIALLVSLPYMRRERAGYSPGQAWRGESVWFGGPRQGLDRADGLNEIDREKADEQTGGVGAQW